MKKNNDFTTISDDFKIQSNKFVLSKIEDELYKEEKNIVMPIVRVKHIGLPNKGDKWKIYADDKVVLVLTGALLNKKEKAFLHSLAGVNFLIAQSKAGVNTANGMRKAVKTHVKTELDKSQ